MEASRTTGDSSAREETRTCTASEKAIERSDCGQSTLKATLMRGSNSFRRWSYLVREWKFLSLTTPWKNQTEEKRDEEETTWKRPKKKKEKVKRNMNYEGGRRRRRRRQLDPPALLPVPSWGDEDSSFSVFGLGPSSYFARLFGPILMGRWEYPRCQTRANTELKKDPDCVPLQRAGLYLTGCHRSAFFQTHNLLSSFA